MMFLVYSAMNAETVVQNFGAPEYSYFFVLREFMPLLQRMGSVITVNDPAQEVDPLYQACRHRGEDCVFLSFSPPHLTCLGLQCPTLPVFAWEFSSMPDETWWEDRPEQDWHWCLAQCAGAIVHSEQSAAVVRQMMGADFPVSAIPAPLWNRLEKYRQRLESAANSLAIEIDKGVVFDTRAPHMSAWLPTMDDIERAVAEARGQIPIDENKGYRRAAPSAGAIHRQYAVSWYQQVWAPLCPESLRTRLDRWAVATNPWEPGRHRLELDGVVFTSLFNPRDGRKNWVDMLMAFCTTFKNNASATLVFKLGHHDYEEAIQGILMVLPRLEAFQCRIVLLHGYLNDAAYFNLLQASHFIVNASYGEGQCLPLMEYLSCGKPAVAPCHSALEDYMDDSIGFVVSSWADATTWPHDPRVAYRTLRQDIDFSSLCRAYQAAYDCYRQQPHQYQQLAHQAIEKMRTHCSLEVAENKLRPLLQHIFSGATA